MTLKLLIRSHGARDLYLGQESFIPRIGSDSEFPHVQGRILQCGAVLHDPNAHGIHQQVRSPDVSESIPNIERVAYRVVQLGTLSGSELADSTVGQQRKWQSHDVVASNHTHFGQALFGANLDLRSNPPNSSGDRRAGDG